MNDNDAKETIFTPRAANTTATLKPIEVTGDVRFMPPVAESAWEALKASQDYLDKQTGVQKTDLFTKRERSETVNKDKWEEASLGKVRLPYYPPSLESRITKLEEQVDALLDRIARHNQRAQHRI